MKPRLSERDIREQFERALKGESGDSSFDGAVAQALGWVLGEYEEPPYEDEDVGCGASWRG